MTAVFPGVEVPTGSRYCAALIDQESQQDWLVDVIVTQLSKVGGEVQINVLTDVQIDNEDRTRAVIGWVMPCL